MNRGDRPRLNSREIISRSSTFNNADPLIHHPAIDTTGPSQPVVATPGFTWGGCPYACRGSGRYSPAPDQARCGHPRGSQVKLGVAVAMTT
jgi:hypothetical protein